MKIKNDLLLRAATGVVIERVPVWMMRQAGRILPQYRALRAKAGSFKNVVKDPSLACEVTLQPVDELGVDAAIIFSDILVISEAMNLNYEIIEKKGVFFEETVATKKDVEQLKVVNDLEEIGYTIEAIKLVKQELGDKIPLIGFAGCPWTLFAYMTEGKGSKTFAKARTMLYQTPEVAHELLAMITQSTIFYLKEQIKAGVDIVQIFDSHAGILSPALFHTFALPYIREICEAITEVPIIVFAKGVGYAMEELNSLPCQVLGLDWTMSPQLVRNQIGMEKSLQGNLDPCLLYANPAYIQKATASMLNAFGHQKHIANLGHGLEPTTPLDGIKCFIDTVKAYEYVAS